MAFPMDEDKKKLTSMRIGVDNVVWCKLTNDGGIAAPTYDTTVYKLPGVMTLNINPNASIETAFYDDGPGDVATTLGNIEVTFNKASLGPKEKAMLLGKTTTTNKLLVSGIADTPPWGALGFRTLKADGTYRYIWLFKGKFTEPADNNETKGESINFQSDEITGRFVKLNYRAEITSGGVTKKKQVWKTEFDPMGNPATQAEIKKVIDAWFAKVPEPGKSPGSN